jgi:pullulanase/glycogen debranching enzyme
LTQGKIKRTTIGNTFVPNISSGQLYAYRIHGPFEPWKGHRYDATKVLLDPYAKVVAVPESYRRSGADFSVAKQNAANEKCRGRSIRL